MRYLTHEVRRMALDTESVRQPCPGQDMPTGVTVVQTCKTPRIILAAQVNLADEEDVPQEIPPQGGGGGTGAGAPGGAASGGRGNDSDEDEETNSAESEDEDPLEGQDGRDYVPRATKGKQMAQMLINFCGLSKLNANAIVVYFSVSTMEKLVEFHEEHWPAT